MENVETTYRIYRTMRDSVKDPGMREFIEKTSCEKLDPRFRNHMLAFFYTRLVEAVMRYEEAKMEIFKALDCFWRQGSDTLERGRNSKQLLVLLYHFPNEAMGMDWTSDEVWGWAEGVRW